MTDLNDVTQFIYGADEPMLDAIREAMKLRHKMIGQQRAASLEIGDVVTLVNLSPKALNGLTGSIKEFSSMSHVTVRLDEESTRTLRWSRSRFSAIPAEVDEYPLTGIPASCCLKNEVAP